MDTPNVGYHVFTHLPVAKRVVADYQRQLPYHSGRGLAVAEVVERLVEGTTEQELLTATATYVTFLVRAKKELRYAESVPKFFAACGEWERFKGGEVPELPADPVAADRRDPGAARAAAADAERRRNMEQLKPPADVLSAEEVRARLQGLRNGIGGMP